MIGRFMDWLCYAIVIYLLPASHLSSRFGLSLLPRAGRHAFADPTPTEAADRHDR